MPYTSAFIQELLRFRTLVPLNVPHVTKQDTKIDGYLFPKKTIVRCDVISAEKQAEFILTWFYQQIRTNIWAVHNDPKLWKNPEIFNPERFLDEQGNFINSNQVIPFSLGPRHCLGEQLAKMEVFIFLVGMVQKFEFLPDPRSKTLPTINDGRLGAVFTPIPYQIIAKEY